MLFQEIPPDTSGYMILGYTFFFIITAIYLMSFFVRSRNLNQDLSMLENMKQESLDEQKAASLKAKPAQPKKSRPKSTTGKTRKKK